MLQMLSQTPSWEEREGKEEKENQEPSTQAPVRIAPKPYLCPPPGPAGLPAVSNLKRLVFPSALLVILSDPENS